MIYPPEIAKSDLPSNRLYNLPPPKSPSRIYPQIVCTIYPLKIAKSDLPSNHLYDLPSNHLYNLPLPIAKSNLPSNCLYDLPPSP